MNKATDQLLYINRSMIDPSLNFEKASLTQNIDHIYADMYEEGDI